MDWVFLDERTAEGAKSFIKLYYDVMDRKREKVIHMYTEEGAVLVWNGNCIEGTEKINRFFAELPLTQHDLVSMDAQKIPSSVNGGLETLVLLAAGSITIQESMHAFTETFTLIMEDGAYKVKSQRLRYVD